MRIAFIVGSTAISGGTRAIFEIAKRLSFRGHKVCLCSLGGKWHTWFNFGEADVEFLYLEPQLHIPFVGSVSLYGIADSLRKMLKLPYELDRVKYLAERIPEGFDIYIATFYPTAISLYLSGVKGSKAYFLQDSPELVANDGGKYGLRLFDLTLRLPFDVFLANSSYTRGLILEKQPNAKVVVTGVGVDTAIFKPMRNSIVDVKKYKVMVILREAKLKGADVAVRTLNEVSKRLPIHALIVGNKSFAKSLLKSLGANFTYTMFGEVPGDVMARVYNSADAFLFTSYVESFGLPPLEAMACGTPVVSTDCLGNRDYAIHGYNALLCKPGDVQCLADSLTRVLVDSELRAKLIKNGLETARQWTWDKVVDKFEEAIKGVVK